MITTGLYWSNPQFHVTLTDQDNDSRSGECTLVVSLLEKEYQSYNKIAIGYDVYRVGLTQLGTSACKERRKSRAVATG